MSSVITNLEISMNHWAMVYDEMQGETALLRDELAEAQARLTEAEKPYREALAAIEGEIIPAVSDHLQETWKHDGVEARYRKGARRVTYKWQTVDSVLGVLRDVLPETAITLEGARSESIGKPSVNVVRVV